MVSSTGTLVRIDVAEKWVCGLVTHRSASDISIKIEENTADFKNRDIFHGLPGANLISTGITET